MNAILDEGYAVLFSNALVRVVFKDDPQDEDAVFWGLDNKNGWLEVRRGLERIVYPVSRIEYVVLEE